MTINQMIEEKRQIGLTNKQVAKESGVPIGTVNKILSGQTKSPRYDTIQKLSAAFERIASEEKYSYRYEEDASVDCVAESSEAFSTFTYNCIGRVSVREIGDSLAFILPKAAIDRFRIKPEDVFDISAGNTQEDSVIMLKKSFMHRTFEDRLADYNGEISIVDFDWGEPLGREML